MFRTTSGEAGTVKTYLLAAWVAGNVFLISAAQTGIEAFETIPSLGATAGTLTLGGLVWWVIHRQEKEKAALAEQRREEHKEHEQQAREERQKYLDLVFKTVEQHRMANERTAKSLERLVDQIKLIPCVRLEQEKKK